MESFLSNGFLATTFKTISRSFYIAFKYTPCHCFWMFVAKKNMVPNITIYIYMQVFHMFVFSTSWMEMFNRIHQMAYIRCKNNTKIRPYKDLYTGFVLVRSCMIFKCQCWRKLFARVKVLRAPGLKIKLYFVGKGRAWCLSNALIPCASAISLASLTFASPIQKNGNIEMQMIYTINRPTSQWQLITFSKL